MVDPILIPLPPEQEAQEFMAAAARKIAGMLTASIASLGYPVGMGMAPHPDACAAAASKITEIFGGAILAAMQGERDVKRLTAELEAAAMWRKTAAPPKVGGHYAVGGYVVDGDLPRHFERAYAHCTITLDGPSWSHCDPAKAHIPLDYWFDLPGHPEGWPFD